MKKKNNKMTCAPSEDADQPGHPPSLIRVFTVRSKSSKRPNLSSRGQGRLIRLGGEMVRFILTLQSTELA